MITKMTGDLYNIIFIVNSEEWKRKQELNKIRKYLNQYITLRIVGKNGKIHDYDKEENYVHLVIKGKYFHYRELKIGKRNLVALNEAPEWIGIDRILCPEYANITEDSVIEECVVLDIEKNYFIECLRQRGELSIIIIKNLLKKMSTSSNRTEYMLINDAKSQVLYWIVEYWKAYSKDERSLKIKLKNEYIADNIGISVRTLYRILKDLKEEELITSEKGNIVVSKEQIYKMEKML